MIIAPDGKYPIGREIYSAGIRFHFRLEYHNRGERYRNSPYGCYGEMSQEVLKIQRGGKTRSAYGMIKGERFADFQQNPSRSVGIKPYSPEISL